MKESSDKIKQLISSISPLLSDFSLFADLASAVELQNYCFNSIESSCYPVAVDYISIKKDFVKSATEAFTILFIKELYLGEGWKDVTIPSSWTKHLKEFWIPEYFKHILISPMTTQYFLSEITDWMKHNHLPLQQIDLFIESHHLASVIQVKQIYAGHYCFGETATEYFIAEFGCGYD